MEDILNRLEKWRLERGLDASQGFEFDLEKQVSFIFEEIGVEYLRADTEEKKIDALCDTVVFCINGASLTSLPIKEQHLLSRGWKGENISSILYQAGEALRRDEYYLYSHSITTICIRNIESLGYDFEKCMDETLKEIESRTGAFNPETGKWEKFKTDEAKALWYTADYSKCKIV